MCRGGLLNLTNLPTYISSVSRLFLLLNSRHIYFNSLGIEQPCYRTKPVALCGTRATVNKAYSLLLQEEKHPEALIPSLEYANTIAIKVYQVAANSVGQTFSPF